MGFRFRKSVKLFPGVRLNFSGSGVSASVGVPGATVNFSKRGRTTTLGLPGTGLSYQDHTPWGGKRQGRRRAPPPVPVPAPYTPSYEPPAPIDTPPPSSSLVDLRSVETARLTCPDLVGVKQMVIEASAQKADLAKDFRLACAARETVWRKLRRREQAPLKWVFGSQIERRRADLLDAEMEALKVAEAIFQSKVNLDFGVDRRTLDAYRELEIAFDGIRCASQVWDVTALDTVEAERTGRILSTSFSRSQVVVSLLFDGSVKTTQAGLRFENANGGDLEIYPGVMIVREKVGADFALIDLRQVTVEGMDLSVIELGDVPERATISEQVWERANRDGSPNRRYSANRQLPVCRYGTLKFHASSGLMEAYQVSEANKVLPFVSAWGELQRALAAMPTQPTGLPVATPEMPTEDELLAMLPTLPAVGGAWGASALVVAGALLAIVWALGQAAGPPQPPVHDTVSAAPAGISIEPAPVRPDSPQPSPLSPDANADVVAGRSAPAAATGPTDRTLAPSAPPGPVESRTKRVAARKAANVRYSADQRSGVVGKVNPGDTFDILVRSGEWAQIGRDGLKIGWIHGSLIEPVD
ncbi:DUF4236 domain-containing protein [Chenggangzhangella methanolivorans]|uniref:DUF4236 domain-containing protein n=1 Tax=Chenggangzhangella methanolivorans TaxID=1437009 RepID=A0A9E6R9G3_9HYPH|nr:DUF4236 domain-containing protein [Chenggangzhangella methanolivorans]QZO00653.1 DUF4236 domain-containing protein [Chenggangzhangella methanolivorans]